MRTLNTKRQRLGLILLILALSTIAILLLRPGHGLHRDRQWDAQDTTVGNLLFTPDNKSLLSAGEILTLWNPAAGTLQSSLHTNAVPDAISPDGRLLACSSTRRPSRRTVVYGLEIWDLKSATQVLYIEHLTWSPTFSPDRTTLASVTGPLNGGASTIETYSRPSLAPLASFPRPTNVRSIHFSPDSKLLASLEGPVIQLLNPKTGKPIGTLTGPKGGALSTLSFSPDGKTIRALFGTYPNSVWSLWTWDVATGKGQQTIQFAHSITVASFSADGQKLAVLMSWSDLLFPNKNRVEVWDVTTSQKIGEITSRKPGLATVCFAPDGAHLAIGFSQSSWRLPAPIGVWSVR